MITMFAAAKKKADWIDDLTHRFQWELQGTYLVCVALAITADLFMVLRLRIDSISDRTWIACNAHPTLEPAGILATVVVAYLVRGSRPLIASAFLLGGHLFTHW